MNPKPDFKIRRFHRLRRLKEDREDLVSNFPMRALNHRLDANSLNLCNLRNLWIFNLRDLG